MVSKPQVPRHFPVIPKNVLESLHIKDDLAEQRAEAREYLMEAYDIFNEYATTGSHTLITSDAARQTLSQNDHSALKPTANEDEAYMKQVLLRSLTPVPTRATCSRDGQFRLLIKAVREDEGLQELVHANPDHILAVVSGTTSSPAFPHFYLTQDNVSRDLEGKAKLKEEAAEVGLNLVEYDSVIPYMHWLDGDTQKVEEILKAEAQACKEFGFTWKSILKASVHTHVTHNANYGADYFRSIYDATKAVLEAGADCAKTSTGLGAMPPLNDLVAKDDGAVAPKSLPMMLAIRDFNKENDAARWPKYSGGNVNEADGAVLRYLTEQICGADIADKMVIAGAPQFRDRHIQFIYEQEGPESGIQPSDFEPYGHDFDNLPAHRLGWGANVGTENSPMPPELIAAQNVHASHDVEEERALQI